MSELEKIQSELVQIEGEEKVLEGEIFVIDEDLTDLIKEKQRLNELLEQVNRKIRDNQAKRFSTNDLLRKTQRNKEGLKLRESEMLRVVKLEEEELKSFELMWERAVEKNFKWVPYIKKHQKEAALKIAQNGSCLLGDEMGLGKSLTAIAAADLADAKRIAVFAPANVTNTFFDEFKMWAPHRQAIPMKSATKQIKEFMTPIIERAEEITLIMNFETLWGRGDYNKKFLEALQNAQFDLVIVDEAHNAKNEDGRTFAFLQRLRESAKHYLPMTGTFLLNSPEDLWPNLYLVEPNKFWDKHTFLRTYCQQDWETGKWLFKSGGAQSLVKSLRGRIIRRTLADTDIVLPKQFISEVQIPWTEVPETQQDVMYQLAQHAQLVVDDTENISITAMIALITRQRQASVWPAGIKIKEFNKDEFGEDIPGTEHVVFDAGKICNESIKIDYAVELLKKRIAEGRRCVVFSQFKTALEALEKRLNDEAIKNCRFDGDTTDPQRQIIKEDFLRPADGTPKSEYLYDVVLANFRTGGVGLTFTEATYMLLLDEEWNPGKNEQAYARINRIGQTEETYVDILRIEQHPGTVDMWMRDLNKVKKAMIDGLEDAIDLHQNNSNLSELFSTGYTAIER